VVTGAAPRRVLLVPDGAAEPVRDGPTSLEQPRTPALDRLAGEGRLARVRTIPPGTAPGTEVGVPALLGLAPVARGRLEAAAHGVEVGGDEGAWRLDVLPGADLAEDDLDRLAAALGELGGRVTRLRGAALLLVGPAWWGDAPPGPHQTDRPLRELAIGPFGAVAKAARTALRDRLAWPWGDLGAPPAPAGTPLAVVTPRPGAVAGLARLLGAEPRADVPDPLPEGLVLVHVPDPDDAAHARDRGAKIAALERVDALADALAARADLLVVCPDHGCDPATGAHSADPVPALVWRRADATRRPGTPPSPAPAGSRPATGPTGAAAVAGGYCERAVAALPVVGTAALPVVEVAA